MKCVTCSKDRFDFLFGHHHGWEVWRCKSCSLVQVQPRPTNKQIEALYHEDLEHFDPYIAQIEVHRAYFATKVTEILKHVSGNTSKIKLLDIGCAMGVLLGKAKEKGMTAYGLDISHDAVAYCRKHGLTVAEGTLASKNLPYKSSQFGVITAFEIIEHELEPLVMMQKIHTLLAPGGMVVVTTPNHAGLWRAIMGKWWFGYQHPEHVNFFDPVSITELFSRAGFHSIQVCPDSPRPFPLSFAFTRAADYFPVIGAPLRLIGKALDGLDIKNPLNPWDDMIVFAKK